MLVHAVDLGKEQGGFHRWIRPAGVAEVARERLQDVARPGGQLRPEAGEHRALHADAIGQRPELAPTFDDVGRGAEDRGQAPSRIGLGVRRGERRPDVGHAFFKEVWSSACLLGK